MRLVDEINPSRREPNGDDWAYIYSTWRKSYWESVKGLIPWRAYHPRQQKIMERLRDDAEFIVAGDPDEPGFIWGWACVEPPSVVHYVYVRGTSQGQGVGSFLLQSMERPLRCTHWTKAAEDLAVGGVGIIYTPSQL